MPSIAHADALADSLSAASKAAEEAQRAAEAAVSAAKSAGTGQVPPAALEQAMKAAEAAKAAAEASASALAALKTAAPAKEAPATTVATAAPAADGASTYAEHIQCEGKNCKIDLWMTRGFRAFSQCQVCHGLDGNGSSFAPSLVDKLKSIDRARFDDVVTNGFKGQVGVMPGWKENPNVMKYLDQLYAYLKARSDGALPAGKLTRYDR